MGTVNGLGDQPPARPSFWNDPDRRALVFQLVVVALVILLAAFLINNTLANLARQGIASGFGFLSETAGFDIATTLISYDETSTYGRAFLVGLLNTLLVSGLGILIATLLGFTIGVARLSSNWLIAKLALVYIEVLRNLPLLLQIFFWYFAVLAALPHPRDSVDLMGDVFLNNRGIAFPSPRFDEGFASLFFTALAVAVVGAIALAQIARRYRERTGKLIPTFWINAALILALPPLAAWFYGFGVSWDTPELGRFNLRGGGNISPEFAALLIALATYTASFIAEIVRAGILAVSKGQTEAAMSLGLSRSRTLNMIIIPQALRVIIPPLTSQYLNLAKNSSLAAAIAYPDLVSVFAGITLNQTGQAVEVIAITMAVYLTMSLTIALVMNIYNRSKALVER